MQTWALFIVIGYFCGSVPFSLLLGRLNGVDIRKVGSGNVGATNLGRAVGRKWGIACFVLDALKGCLPVLAAGAAAGVLGKRDMTAMEQLGWMAVAAAAIAGHVFPIWLKFKGGKGVATGFGAMLGLFPLVTLPALGALATWGVVTLTTRYIGLASVVGALLLPVYFVATAILLGVSVASVMPMLAVVCVLALLVVIRHRTNLVRLWQGTESKIGAPMGSPDDLPGTLDELKQHRGGDGTGTSQQPGETPNG